MVDPPKQCWSNDGCWEAYGGTEQRRYVGVSIKEDSVLVLRLTFSFNCFGAHAICFYSRR